jgi:hypothetical protein
LDLGAPSGEGFIALARIGTDRDRSADMIEHDPCLREGMRQIDDVAELGLEDPSVESQIQRDQRRTTWSDDPVLKGFGGPVPLDSVPFRSVWSSAPMGTTRIF